MPESVSSGLFDDIMLSGSREAQIAELHDNPAVAGSLFALTHREVGGQGKEAQQAFMETVFNRATARGKSIADTISDRKYYPAVSLRPISLGEDKLKHYGTLLNDVASGSNISNGATGNAWGKVGFAGGPQTKKIAGEKFGVEGPDIGKSPAPTTPTPSPTTGGAGLFDDIVGGQRPAAAAEPTPSSGLFDDIMEAIDTKEPPPLSIPDTPRAAPTPTELPTPEGTPDQPNFLTKTARAVAKYGRDMIPTSGAELARAAGLPLDWSQPEELARLMMPPPMRYQMDLIQQAQNRMTQVANAEESAPYSQERFDAGIGTALDLLGVASIGVGVKALSNRGIRPFNPREVGQVTPKTLVPEPPGTAGAVPPPVPEPPSSPVQPQANVAPAEAAPVAIVTQAERDAIKYSGDKSTGLTPEDVAALDEVAPPPPITPEEPPTVPPGTPTVSEPAPAAPRRPVEKAVSMKVRPLTQLRRQLSAAEKAGEIGFKRGSREAREATEAAAKAEAKQIRDTLQTADRWLDADVKDVSNILQSFSRHLPLHERGKFIPAINKAIRKPSVFSRHGPKVIRRRAAELLDRMTEAIYKQHKKEAQTKIGKLLDKIEASPSIILSQKRVVQQIRKTFNNLKDKMSLEMLERMRDNLKWQEAHGRDLFNRDQSIEQIRKDIALREMEAQGARKANEPKQSLLSLTDVEKWWDRQTSRLAKVPATIKRFNAAITPMDWVFQLFDQRQFGKLWEHLKAPIDIQYGQFLDTAHVYKTQLIDLLNRHKLDDLSLRRIYAHAEYRQEGGEANLKAMGYSDKDIATIKNVGQLNHAERAYLKEADAILKQMFPAIKNVLEKFYNQDIQDVPGYFPRIRDWDHYNSLSIEEGKFAEAYRRTNVRDGFTKERQGTVTKNLGNAHDVMMKHIDDAVYHMTMGPDIKRAAMIIGDDRFKALTGDFGQRLFADWVDVLARNGGGGDGGRFAAVMNTLRKNVGVAQLAYRLTTTFLQPTSLIQALPYLNKSNLARTLTDFGNPANREWILKNFPEVKHRLTDDPAAMGYTKKSIRDKAARVGFAPIAGMDRWAAMTVAETAYRDALARRGITFNRNNALHMQAYAEAMNIVRNTQASPFTKDVPLAISGGKFTGNKAVNQAVFQFQNFTMNRWALIKYDALQMGVIDKSPLMAARVAAYIITASIVEQMLREGIANGLRAIVGVTEKDEQRMAKDAEKSTAQRVSEQAAVDLALTMPILSNVAGMYRYDSSGLPIADTLTDVVKGARSAIRGKRPETQAAGAIRAVQGVGGALGLPTGQAGDILSRLIRGQANAPSGYEGPILPPMAPPPPPPPPPPAY